MKYWLVSNYRHQLIERVKKDSSINHKFFFYREIFRAWTNKSNLEEIKMLEKANWMKTNVIIKTE